jgi:protein TonB
MVIICTPKGRTPARQKPRGIKRIQFEMAVDLTSPIEPAAAGVWPPQRSRGRATRSATERFVTLGIIGALHVVGVLAIWTRHVLVEAEPGPLVVNQIETIVPDTPPPPPPVPSIAVPAVVLAPPLPPSIEVIEEAPTAITAREAPPELPAPAPALNSQVIEARFDVDYLNNPKPVYPPLSRRLREEGVVVLKVHVRSDGTVETAMVDKRSGSVRLDEAALAAVKQWHFVPARRGTEPVASWVLVPIEFELQS